MEEKEAHFQIYGRTSYEQPLTFLKEVTVRQSLTEETLAAVGHDGWVELIAVPTAAFLHVTGKKEDG